MAGILRWEDPPPFKSGRGANVETLALIADLQAHPGRWALITDNAKSSGHGTFRTLRRAGCDLTVRSNPDGTHRTYACWPVDGPKPIAKRAPRKAKVVNLPEPTPVKRETAAEPHRSGDKALRCEDCGFTAEVGMAMQLARHTRATHGRSPLTIEKTPRTASEAS